MTAQKKGQPNILVYIHLTTTTCDIVPQDTLISIESVGWRKRSSSVPSAQSARVHRFDPRRGRFNAM